MVAFALWIEYEDRQ